MSGDVSGADRRAFGILVSAFGIFCAAGLYRVVAVLFSHVPLDPNEGWNAYLAAAAVGGGPLYPVPPQLLINNYPPLSFYLIGGIGRLVGDNIFAGRVCSLASFFVAAGLIVTIARRMGARAWPAVFGAAFFSSVLLLESDYVGMNDPQLPGHVLELGALLLVLSERRSFGAMAGAALMFAAALFIKQTLFALPIAVFAWMFLEHRKNALTFAGCLIAFGILGLFCFRLAFGTGLLGHLLSPRAWSLSNFVAALLRETSWLTIPLVGLGWRFTIDRQNRYVKFCALYSVLAIGFGLLFMGGDGVDANALFDAAIALSLSTALVLDAIVSRRLMLSSIAGLVFAAPLAIVLFTSIDSDWYTTIFWTRPWSDEKHTAETDIAFLRASPGRALCQTSSLCYWAGKRDAFDLFNISEAYAAGTLNPGPLVVAIEQKRFATIEWESPAAPPSLTRAFTAAFHRNYELCRTSDEAWFFCATREQHGYASRTLTVPVRSSFPQPTKGPLRAVEIERTTT